MIFPLILLLSACPPSPANAAEGFKPSTGKNVMMVKGRLSGATAFLLRTPSHGMVLVTQKHVVDDAVGELTIQRGNAVGMLLRLKVVEPQAFQKALTVQKIWESEDLGLTVLKPPMDLTALCRCDGFVAGKYADGSAALVGYPITEMRIAPRTNRLFSLWNQLWGQVRQQRSEGLVKKEGAEFVGDIDALPGNSGSPILNKNVEVIGVLKKIQAKAEEGYRYRNLSLTFYPIQLVLDGLARAGK